MALDRPLAPSRNRINLADPPKLSPTDLLALPRSTRVNHVSTLLSEKTRQVEKTGELGQALTKQEAELKVLLHALKSAEGMGAGGDDEALTLKRIQTRLEQFRGENEGLLSSLVDFDTRITLSHATTARIPASASQTLLPRSVSGGLELHEGKAIAETLVTEVRRLQALVNERDESLARLSTDKDAERERYTLLEVRLRELEDEKNRIAEASWDHEVRAQEAQTAHDEAHARTAKFEKENQKAQLALSKLKETSEAQKAENERLTARVAELEEERKVEGAKMRAEQQRIKRDNSDLRETLNAMARGKKKSFNNLRGSAGGNTPSPLGAGAQRRRVPVGGEGDDEEVLSPQGDDVFGGDTIGRKRRRGPGVEADGNILDAQDQYSDFEHSFDASFDNASPLRSLAPQADSPAAADVAGLHAELEAARAEIAALRDGQEAAAGRSRGISILSDAPDSDTSVIAPRRGGRTVSRGVRGIRRGVRGGRGAAAFARQDRSFSHSPQAAFASSPMSTPGRNESVVSDGDRFNTLDRPIEFGDGFGHSPESIKMRPDSFYGKPLDLDLGDDLPTEEDEVSEGEAEPETVSYVNQGIMTDPVEEEAQVVTLPAPDAQATLTPTALGFFASEVATTPRRASRLSRDATPETEGTTDFEDAKSEASTPRREDTIRLPPLRNASPAATETETEGEYADARSVATLTPSSSGVDLHRLSISSDDFYSMAEQSSADEDSEAEQAPRPRPRKRAEGQMRAAEAPEPQVVYVDRIVEKIVPGPAPEPQIVYVDRPYEVLREIPGPERVVEKVIIKEIQAPTPEPQTIYVDRPYAVPGPQIVVEKLVPHEVIKEVVKEIPGPERLIPGPERIVEKLIPGPERLVPFEVIKIEEKEVIRYLPGPETVREVEIIKYCDREVPVETIKEVVREVLVPTAPTRPPHEDKSAQTEAPATLDDPPALFENVSSPKVEAPTPPILLVDKAAQTEDAPPLSAVLAAPVADLGLYRVSAGQEYEFLKTAPVSPGGSHAGSVGRRNTMDAVHSGSPVRSGSRIRPALLTRGDSDRPESASAASTDAGSGSQMRAPPRMNLPPPPDMPPPATLPLKRMSSDVATPARPMSPPPLEYLQRAVSPRLAPEPFASTSASAGRRQQNASTPAHIGRRHPSSASLQAMAGEARKYDSVKLSREAVKRKADVVVIASSRNREQSLRSASAASTRSSELGLPSLPQDDVSQHNAVGHGSTDPLVITAITQTMIGEFMWKDTRRNFSTQMSGNRHKRFFWIHPYTKTLYWSQSDPGGEHTAESKAKSVYIAGIKTVESAEPGGHGMWRETIVITTPNRDIHMTAPTEERHNAWMTALGYLVQRPSQATMSGSATIVPPQTMSTPVRTDFGAADDFGMRRFTAAASLRSFGSELTTPKAGGVRSQSAMSGRRSTVTGKRPGTAAHAYLSDFGRTEDFEQISLREARMSSDDAFEGMENVRACCDGRHDVGSITHKHTQRSGRSQTPSFKALKSLSRRTSDASVVPPRLTNAGATPGSVRHRPASRRTVSRASSRPASPAMRA